MLVLVALIPPAMPLQVSTMVLQSRVSVITLHSIHQCAQYSEYSAISRVARRSIDGQEDEVWWWEEEG